MADYLRDYQKDCRDSVIRDLSNGSSSALYVQPTGTGKTEVALDIIDQWPDKDCDILCLSHRQELVYQPFNRWYQKTGHYAEMEMSEYKSTRQSRVTFASKDSLHPGRLAKTYPDPKCVGLIWVDEAHHLAKANKSYSHILEYFMENNPDCRMFGCTATPDRTDEKALGQSFDVVSYEYPLVDPNHGPSAIGDGWLVDIEQEMVTVEELAFDAVGRRGGDFIDGQLQKMLTENHATEKIVAATRAITNGTTLCFTAGVDQAMAQAVIFNAEDPGSAMAIASRIPEEYRQELWAVYSQDPEARQRALKMWGRGEFKYFVNVGVFTEGTDEPRIRAISMGRPTNSRSLYAQMVGRGTRILPGVIEGADENGNRWRIDDKEERKKRIAESEKSHVLVLDFVGNSRHPLMSSVDILGGSYDDEVVEKAKEKVSKGDRNVTEALEEAAKEVAEDRRRSQVKARASFRRRAVDPFNVLNVVVAREPGYHRGRKPTRRQVEALRKFKIEDQRIEKMSFWQATQLMDKLVDRVKSNKCTYRQSKILLKHGFDPENRSFQEASQVIDKIAKSGWSMMGGEV